MNHYKELYERYYNNLTKGKRNISVNRRQGHVQPNFNSEKKLSLANKFIIQLSIAIVMMIFFLGCKTVNNEYGNKVLKCANGAINKKYDYKYVVNRLENMTLDDVENVSVQMIDKIKAGFVGGKTIIEELETEYSIPVMANKSSEDDAHRKDKDNIITFSIKEKTPIKSCNSGKIKKIDVDKNLGEYIIIDHGKGIESKYYNISKIFVKVGDKVDKDTVIGEVDVSPEGITNFYFEILYMGKAQDIYNSMVI
ncbi:M23 family metallopeptidase [Clostridium sp. CTA-19]